MIRSIQSVSDLQFQCTHMNSYQIHQIYKPRKKEVKVKKSEDGKISHTTLITMNCITWHHHLVKELVDPFQIEWPFIGEIKEVININV